MTNDDWRVRLQVPATTRFLHIVRLTAAGAAAEAGLDADEVEDVTIAIDELCSVAIAAAPEGSELTLDFAAGDGTLTIEASTPRADPGDIDELGRAILEATVDAFDYAGSGRGGFHLTKSHRVR